MDAARAAWRRILGLLDSFFMSLSTRLSLSAQADSLLLCACTVNCINFASDVLNYA